MSMICHLMGLSDESINQLLSDPEQIRTLLYEEEEEPRTSKPGLLARLFRGTEPLDPKPTIPKSSIKHGPIEDLDKAWHGLHYLITGTDWEGDEPLCYLVKGGSKIGDVDVGYGPARVLRNNEIKSFAAALESISEEELRRRFDPVSMMSLDIYPSIWNEGETSAFDEYLLPYSRTLRDFIHETARQNEGILIWLD